MFTDADEVIDVVKDIVMEESDNEVHSDCSESFSVSEEESDDDENGKYFNMYMIRQYFRCYNDRFYCVIQWTYTQCDDDS